MTVYSTFTVEDSSYLYYSVFFFQDLSNNHLQSAGAEYVSKMLVDSISVKSMKLSGDVHIYTTKLYWQYGDVLRPRYTDTVSGTQSA